MLFQQDDEEVLSFTRKMFTFFAMQKIFLALFIVFVYNNVTFTQLVRHNFFIFAISAFIFLTILMMVHTALDFVKRSP